MLLDSGGLDAQMKRRGDISTFRLVIATTCLFVVGCQRELDIGTRTYCKFDGLLISDDVRVVAVPVWSPRSTDIRELRSYCDTHGEELVPYTVEVVCEHCGATIHAQQRFAPRREERRNQTHADGYCSTRCRNMAAVERGADRIGEAAGRIGGALIRGIERGADRR